MKVTLARSGLAAMVAFATLVSTSQGRDVPQNLGYGLDALVDSNIALKTAGQTQQQTYNGYATEAAAYYGGEAITDRATGRVMVDITLSGRVTLDDVRSDAQAKIASLTITAIDRDYRSTGILEGYVSVDDAPALAKIAGVRGVFLALKPEVNRSGGAPSIAVGEHLFKLGTTFDQGVLQHRVDRINQIYNPSAPVNYDGTGMSVGLMSDSFDTRAAAPHAATAVTNFDLPGAPTNPVNTQPVVVLEDEPAAGTDEGRAMAEIVYKMAPRARLAYATGAIGEVQFGNDIRALAGMPGFTYPPAIQQGFKADTIADDISYGGEPFYGESIIGNAIDDATAFGVSYFSSAGNNIGINAYESPLRIVPNGTGLTAATNSALVGTNINLATVPVGLYAGGFHNFNPAAGQLDVAQLVNMPTAAQSSEMQWDDPYDQRDLTLNQPPIYSNTGNSTAGSTVTFDLTSTPPLPPLTAGQSYVIQETATSGNFDGIVNIFDSSNNLIVSQDTGTDETVTFYPPVTDQYHITIAPFVNGGVPTAGNFTLTINTANGVAGVTTDLNLLVFRADTGAYISTRSLTTNNLANNRPVELGSIASPTGQTQIQFVIARANNPVAPQLPTRVRWSVRGNGAGGIGPAEYFTYNAVTTKGHATAKGCNGTAAFSVFRPSLPESFTSPGPATILFDKNANRLAVPEIRQQPRVAAADAANESFFSGDSGSDLDTNPNFSGTSAAAPHAAAIAALVLQSRGGPGSVTPAQMTSILQSSAFPHDLDPSSASGFAATSDGGSVTLTIDSDNDTNTATGQNDPNSWKLSYNGPGSIASITFNPLGSPAYAGHVTAGNNGYTDDVGSSPATISYLENSYPGLLFIPTSKAFTLGTLTGLTPADIAVPLSASPFTGFSNLGPPPANGTNQFWTMTVGFPTAQFSDGKSMRFTVARGAAHSSSTAGGVGPTGGTITLNPIADSLGGGVMLPSGTVIADGMAFSGTTTSGGTFSGRIKNRIGAGYSPVDGYGFIDASVATGVNLTSLLASGSATPSFASVGGSTLLTVNVTPGANPTSTGIYVTADLTSIGGSATQQLFDNGTNGDVTSGDNIYSFNATVPTGTSAGAKSFGVTVTDVQSRNGSAAINFAVLAATNPSGVGAASPSTVNVTQSSLLTVAVTPGAGPTSTGIAVKADLSSIGGSATAAFHDDGLAGDVTAGDGTYSFNATVPVGTAPGAKSFPVTITDAQARTAASSIALSVNTPSAPTATAAASPDSGTDGATTLLTVTVTPGANPASSGVTVTGDLSSIGGSATSAFHDDGANGDVTAADGIYSFSATVGNAVAAGPKLIPISVTDAQNRSASASIAFNVLSQGALSATGLSTPASVGQGEATTLIVSVTPGTNPASTGVTVTVDLSSIGGSATQTFYDDGTHGDSVAGDNLFSYHVVVPANQAIGPVSLPATIADAQSRTASATINLTINDVIFQDGFE